MADIKDVAKLAGVSVATVSRTLDKPDLVAEATRQKVLRAVSECGYVANTLARNFRRRRSNTVLVLVPDIANPFFSSIIRGIEGVALAAGYRVLLGDTQNDPAREQAYSELVAQRQADGLICLGMNLPFATDKRRKSVDPKWPPVVMACEYDGTIPVPTVCIDNVAAAAEAVRHLVSLGHRDVAFINGPAASPICKDRLDGFRRALAAAGVRPRRARLRNGDFSLASGREQMLAILAQGDPPTAVFCANDEMAIGAMKAARERGMTLPRDLSVVGFDDIGFAAYATPALSTVRQPREQIGEQAMRLMLDILQQRGTIPAKVVLPHALVLRASTAKPLRD